MVRSQSEDDEGEIEDNDGEIEDADGGEGACPVIFTVVGGSCVSVQLETICGKLRYSWLSAFLL